MLTSGLRGDCIVKAVKPPNGTSRSAVLYAAWVTPGPREDAEEHRRRADAEWHGEHRHRCEPGLEAQQPEAVSRVPQQPGERRDTSMREAHTGRILLSNAARPGRRRA